MPLAARLTTMVLTTTKIKTQSTQCLRTWQAPELFFSVPIKTQTRWSNFLNFDHKEIYERLRTACQRRRHGHREKTARDIRRWQPKANAGPTIRPPLVHSIQPTCSRIEIETSVTTDGRQMRGWRYVTIISNGFRKILYRRKKCSSETTRWLYLMPTLELRVQFETCYVKLKLHRN